MIQKKQSQFTPLVRYKSSILPFRILQALNLFQTAEYQFQTAEYQFTKTKFVETEA